MGFKPLYKKPTDVSPLLHALSFHPISPKKGVIYSQALRHRRIITNDDDFAYHLEYLQAILIKRGYNIGLISEIFAKVRSLSRSNLLQYHHHSPMIKLPLVVSTIQIRPKLVKLFTVTGTLSRRMMNYRIYHP